MVLRDIVVSYQLYLGKALDNFFDQKSSECAKNILWGLSNVYQQPAGSKHRQLTTTMLTSLHQTVIS